MMLSSDDYLKKRKTELAIKLAPLWENSERRYRAGDKNALLATITLCVFFGILVPYWARNALFDIVDNPPKSWDDAFGAPLPKGKSSSAARRHREVEFDIVLDVETAGAPIDEDLFERVGKKYNVSGGTAKRIYYGVKDRDLLLSTWALTNKAHAEMVAAGVDLSTWLQQHEGELASFADDFLGNRKRLRNSRSARKQRTSQKSVKD
jgi:hypothetical protein